MENFGVGGECDRWVKELYQFGCSNWHVLPFILFATALSTPARKIFLILLHLPKDRTIQTNTFSEYKYKENQ